MPKYSLPHVLEPRKAQRESASARPHVQATLTPFARLLRRYCSEHEVSLYEMADQVGVTRTTAWLWYRCGRLPSAATLVKLHETLGISADELLRATTSRIAGAPTSGKERTARQTRRRGADDGWDAWVLSLARIRDPKRRRAIRDAVEALESSEKDGA